MKAKGIQFSILAGIFILMALLVSQLTWFQQAFSRQQAQFGERVNLALRQTGDRLLALSGDRKSRIPPVRQTGDHTWRLDLEQGLPRYDSLPSVLQAAFNDHRLNADYYVTLYDCSGEELLLGYTASLYLRGEEIPCGSREQRAGCLSLQLSLLDQPLLSGEEMRFRIAFAAICFLGLGFLGFQWYTRFRKARPVLPVHKNGHQSDEQIASGATAALPQTLRFGRSELDITNQTLQIGQQVKSLTYRETKLLQFFARHPNQLLDRDLILKAVWEDEGLLVGRSVDVFVSRLRKLLKEDEALRLANVHGVGYRLEVRE